MTNLNLNKNDKKFIRLLLFFGKWDFGFRGFSVFENIDFEFNVAPKSVDFNYTLRKII